MLSAKQFNAPKSWTSKLSTLKLKNSRKQHFKSIKCVQTPQLLRTEADIKEYIQKGPLLEGCRISAADIEANLSEWMRIGDKFCQQLGFEKTALGEKEGIRVYHYYLPVYMWLQAQLQAHRKESGNQSTMMVGMSAPQGCGKSTLVSQLYQLFESEGLRTVTFSLDDFYWTRQEQQQTAEKYSENPLLEFRGNAGTHDLNLAQNTLSYAKKSKSVSDFNMAIPRYNKAAYKGLGDQKPKNEWPKIAEGIDIVLFEGWMLGFRAQSDENVATVDKNLIPVNQALQKHIEYMDQYMDAWLVIKVQDPRHVFDWRLQAELEMKAGGKPGMTDEQIEDFVSRFMPAYNAYLPDLYKNGPTTSKPGKLLVVEVNQQREPVQNQPKPIM